MQRMGKADEEPDVTSEVKDTCDEPSRDTAPKSHRPFPARGYEP